MSWSGRWPLLAPTVPAQPVCGGVCPCCAEPLTAGPQAGGFPSGPVKGKPFSWWPCLGCSLGLGHPPLSHTRCLCRARSPLSPYPGPSLVSPHIPPHRLTQGLHPPPSPRPDRHQPPSPTWQPPPPPLPRWRKGGRDHAALPANGRRRVPPAGSQWRRGAGGFVWREAGGGRRHGGSGREDVAGPAG